MKLGARKDFLNASYRWHTRALEEIKKEKTERAAQLCAEFAEKRMERAMKIAEKRGLNVTEIAEHVGNMTYKYKHVNKTEAGTHGKGKGQK